MGRPSQSLNEDSVVSRMQGYLMCMSNVGSQFARIHTLTPRFRPDLPMARIALNILLFLLWRKCKQVSYQGTLRIHNIRVFSLPSSSPCLLQMNANGLPALPSNWPRVLLLRSACFGAEDHSRIMVPLPLRTERPVVKGKKSLPV